jgi:hypothetical protein
VYLFRREERINPNRMQMVPVLREERINPNRMQSAEAAGAIVPSFGINRWIEAEAAGAIVPAFGINGWIEAIVPATEGPDGT